MRSVNAARRSSGRGAAPEITVLSAPRPPADRSSVMILSSSAGASGRLVTCSASTTSKKPSKPSMITNRAPAPTQLPSTALRPNTWNSGSMAKTTVSGPTTSSASRWLRWASSARWVSIAALGSPEVPAV